MGGLLSIEMTQMNGLNKQSLRSFVSGGKYHMAQPNTWGKAKRGRGPNKPIDLYYWPTPNGWKISIMLEGVRAGLQRDPGEHCAWRSIQAGFP